MKALMVFLALCFGAGAMAGDGDGHSSDKLKDFPSQNGAFWTVYDHKTESYNIWKVSRENPAGGDE